MEPAMTRNARNHRTIAGAVLTVALAALIGGLSSLPARADNDDRGRNVQNERSQRDRHPPRHTYVREAPRYDVYSPPPVYYAPPPPPPVIDFVFPLNFR